MKHNEILNHNHPPNGLKEQLVNASIVGGMSFFGTLAGLGATQAIKDPVIAVVASAISFGVSFFASLVAQRGLQRKPQ